MRSASAKSSKLTSMSPFRSRRTLRKVAIVFATFLMSLYVVYVLAVWLALREGFLDWFTKDKPNLKMHVASGYSLWPGVIHVEEASFRFMDYNIEIGAFARKATVDFAPLSLFVKTVHIERVAASGARYKMIHRVHDGHQNRKRLAVFPDLGFERSRIYDSPKPPSSPPKRKVKVEQIEADVDEAWILEYRLPGPIKARGGFEVFEDIHVYPSEVTFQNTDLYVGAKRIAANLSCQLTAEIGPVPEKDSQFKRILGETVGTVDCSSRIEDPSFFDIYFPDAQLALEGRGEGRAMLNLDRGRLVGSRLEGTMEMKRFGVDQVFLSGTGQTLLEVDEEGAASMVVDWTGQNGSRGAALEAAHLESLIHQSKLWELEVRSATLDVTDANLIAPDAVRSLLGPTLPLFKAEKTRLHIDYCPEEDKQLEGGAKAGTGRFVLTANGSGALVLFPSAQTSTGCTHDETISCRGRADTWSCSEVRLSCQPLSYQGPAQERTTWNTTLSSHNVEVKDLNLTSDWVLSANNPKSLLKAVAAQDLWSKLGLAVAPLGDVHAEIRLNKVNETVAGTVRNFRSGVFSGRGAFVFSQSLVSRWNIQTPLGRMGLDQRPGATSLQPFIGADWDTLDFSGR